MRYNPGSTSITEYFKLIDDATGLPSTGLTVTDLDITYTRNRAAAVKADASLLGAVDAAYASNSMIEVDATNSPGLYRVDLPNAALVVGVDKVIITINGTAIDPADMRITLDLTSQEDNIVEGTLTNRMIKGIVLAAVAGKSNTLGKVFRDSTDTYDRITATTDANGRTTIVFVTTGLS